MVRMSILIPLDGSEFSREVVPHVTHLFAPATSTVTLLRVGHMPEGLVGLPPRPLPSYWPMAGYDDAEAALRAHHPIYATQAEASARANLGASEAVLAHSLEAAGYAVQTVVCFGEPVEEIVRHAEQARVDLIAMATHGRSGLRGMVLGSVAEQVLRHATVPVLFFRPCAPADEPRA